MTLNDFRRLVRQEFGKDLRHITPANVREFVDRIQDRVGDEPAAGGRYAISESERTYEGILRDFLARTLDMPAEKAVILLWLYSLEMATASVSEIEEARFERLFAALESSGEG